MKMNGQAANAYFRKPDPAHTGLLIFGADPMRVAEKRQEAIAALVGPQGEEEMRLTRINGADLRKDPALLNDAIKAQGFFPGHRVAFVEDATDTLAKIVEGVLIDWQPGDAQLVITAGQLTAKSALRKLFEVHRNAVAVGIYDDPPTVGDIEQTLAQADIPRPGPDVMEALMALAGSLEPGDFRQTIEKVSLYKLGDDTPLTVADIMANAPQSADVDVDDILDVVSQGQADALGPVLRSLYAQGVTPVTLCIGAMRHFRRLHVVACDPGGPAAGVGRLRPPVFGPRRDKIARQAGQWGRDRLERALTALTDVDLSLRSASRAPQAALMERTLIRLAMMARR
ncbi:DNA polymerase III subunit delta [Yoonia sediminilitoris]|uniref:DNA-directed DNA polymerase n=1 Tax=Yoonia sediminilitoris TaxID=1286148 RepID=A0A2T6K9U8_9RHOB|nr:DNA polymerase III subunit delta [Yoonia sediminilitoris]PUB11601.1 DNA polymerase III delta subunit [Yoonia sediminilitoris]RCW91801.1 DNA polymerase III delta subunit [Yoonia sediminilitoris]